MQKILEQKQIKKENYICFLLFFFFFFCLFIFCQSWCGGEYKIAMKICEMHFSRRYTRRDMTENDIMTMVMTVYGVPTDVSTSSESAMPGDKMKATSEISLS